MAERIQDILARQKALAIEAGNRQAAERLGDLQRLIAREVARGLFTQDPDIFVETPGNQRRFSPEQLQGLQLIGFTFVREVQALSLDQLSRNPSTKHLFGYVTDIAELRNTVPVARQVAVNPKQPFVEGSEHLGYDDQLEVADKIVRKLESTSLKRGTLEGINFAPGKASVLAQLDFVYQASFNGRKLYPDYLVRSQDEYNHPSFGPRVSHVGRRDRGNPLSVRDWSRHDPYPRLRLSLVATPVGTR